MADDPGKIVLDENFEEEGIGHESSSCRERHFQKMRPVCGYRSGFGGRNHSLRFIRASKGKHKRVFGSLYSHACWLWTAIMNVRSVRHRVTLPERKVLMAGLRRSEERGKA